MNHNVVKLSGFFKLRQQPAGAGANDGSGWERTLELDMRDKTGGRGRSHKLQPVEAGRGRFGVRAWGMRLNDR